MTNSETEMNVNVAERLAQELSVIAKIGRIVSSTLNIAEVYERFTEEVQTLIPSDRISVSLHSVPDDRVWIAYSAGTICPPGRAAGDSFPLKGSLNEHLIRTRKGLLILPDCCEDLVHTYPTFINSYRAGTRSVMSVPLISRDEVIGTLAFRARRPKAYTPENLHLAERIAEQIAGAIANAQLFAELTKAQQSLRESEWRFRTIFDSANDAIFIHDMNTGEILDVNQTMCAMYGYRREEALRLAIGDLCSGEAPYTHADASAWIEKAAKGKPQVFEWRSRAKDGRLFWTEVNIRQVAVSGKIQLLATAQDITERKRIQEEIKEEQKRTRIILGTITTPIIISRSSDNKVLYANQAAAQVYHTTVDQFIGSCATDYIAANQADVDQIAEILQRQGYVSDYEIHSQGIDGKSFWTLNSARIIHYQNEPCIISSFVDITDRKRTERETATLAKIGRIIGSSPEVGEVYERFAAEARKLIPCDRLSVSIINVPALTVTNAYVFGKEIAGRSPGEVFALPGSFNEVLWKTRKGHLILPESLEELAGRFPSLVRSYERGMRSLVNVPLISRDEVIGGLHFWSEKPHAYSERDLRVAERIGEQIAGAISNCQLFSELKKTEGSLRESEAQYRELIDLLPISIFEVDNAARIRTVNRTALNTFGYSEREAQEAPPVSQFFLPEELERMTGKWQRILEGTPMPGQEFTFVRKDSSTFPGLIYVSRIMNENKFSGIRGAIIDITTRKQLEEERLRLEERLRRAEKMEALGTLAGGVAHDLNNVLGVLVGFAELLQEKIPEGNSLKRYAAHILQSGLKGAAIIQDLLTLARRGVAVAGVVQLNQAVKEYLASPEFESLRVCHPEVRFRTTLEEDLLPIKGSPVHLGKTVMNLISNAVEAITGPGEVTIRTENRYLDRPIGRYDDIREGDYALLTVSDTGQGISPQDLEKIFEPFYTKKVMGRSGTGLGLAVVWGTVKDHGGYIDVTSREEEGSAFSLFFPVTRESLSPDREAASPESYLGKGETILVVDDVPEQRELAVSMLTRLGYAVEAVSGGDAALAFLRLRNVDLVVLDMIMDPGMDGLETYQRIVGIHPGQKAIIVSGFSETDRVKAAQALGAGAYVRKPYVLERIGAAIRNELARKTPYPS